MIHRLLTVTAVLGTLLVLPTQAHAGDKEEALARELLVVTGAADLGKQVMDGMLDQFKMSGADATFIDEFSKLAKPEDLTELIVPIYVEHLDASTMQAAIDFYKSDEGKKLIAAMPPITQASMMAGQQWGMELGAKAQQAMMKGQ